MLALRRMREASLFGERHKVAGLMNLHRATFRREGRFVESPALPLFHALVTVPV